MERKVDEKELKVQEDAIKEIGYKNLPYYNVEDRIVEMIQNDDSSLKCKKVEEFVNEYNIIKVSNDFNKAVLKAALAKKCVGEWCESLRFDEDVSLFSNYIFTKTAFSRKEIEIKSFDDNDNKWIINYQGHSYRGDTMNSWSTTLNEFIREFGADFIDGYNEGKIPEGYNTWESFLSKPENFKKPLPWYITEFMDVVYTIGNFIPVPGETVNFNMGRNKPVLNRKTKVKGTEQTGDYWDLTLLAVYQYYYGEKPSKLAKLLEEEEVKSWLNSFGSKEDGWNGFVEKNFMSPFVEKNEKGFGRPRELWDGHFEECVLPQNKAQFEQFFVNAKVRILARGKLIAEELDKQLKNKNKIQNDGEIRADETLLIF